MTEQVGPSLPEVSKHYLCRVNCEHRMGTFGGSY
jgi:hypothetical protein